MALTQSKENSKDNVPCKQISKLQVSQEEQNSKVQVSQEEQSSKVEVSQEEHAYRELTSRHANTRLQLEIGGIIGRGSFGTVHAARWRRGRACGPPARPPCRAWPRGHRSMEGGARSASSRWLDTTTALQ